jgi:MFS family permease
MMSRPTPPPYVPHAVSPEGLAPVGGVRGERESAALPRAGWSLALITLAIGVGGAMRLLFSPVQELAKLDLGLSDFKISLVQGLAASVPIALLSIPVGRLVDRTRRSRLLVAMAVIWSVGTLMTAMANGFAVLFIARMLAGLGAVCALPVAISILADLTAPERRGRAMVILSLGQYVGMAAAFAVGGWLSGALIGVDWSWLVPGGLKPWRAVHLVVGVASVLLSIPLLLLREPARHETGNAPDAALAPVLRELWTRRGFLAPLFIGQVSVVMADTAAAIWATPVLMRNHGLQPAQFSAWLGGIILLSGIVGSTLGGFAADYGQKSQRRGGILWGAVVAAALSVAAALYPVAPSVGGFAMGLALFLICGVICGIITATAIAVLVPNEVRGVCLGAFIVVGSVVGLGVAPTLVTLVSSALGGEAHLAQALSVTGAAVSAMSLVAFAFAMLRTPRSMGRAD